MLWAVCNAVLLTGVLTDEPLTADVATEEELTAMLFVLALKHICLHYYLREVNGVNAGDTGLIWCVCVCVTVRSKPVNQTSLKRLKQATDFKFDMHVPRDSPDMNP